MHGAAQRPCKFCPVNFCKAVHKCASVGLSCYSYDLSLDITHCDAAARAVERAELEKASSEEGIEALRHAAAASWDRFVQPNDLDLGQIVASLQLRRFGGRHVIVSRFTTDDGKSQSATTTVHLGPSDIVVGGRRLTGMKVLQPDDDELPEGFTMLLYGGVPGGPPEMHDLVRDATRWGDRKQVLFQPLGLAIMRTGDVLARRYVDPRWIGNLGVTLNHSCAPNTEATHVLVRGKSFTLLRLLTGVRGSDTELRWDYASTCDRKVEQIDCACGASNCGGKMCRFKKSDEAVQAEKEAKRIRFSVRPPHARESTRVRAKMMSTGRLAEQEAIRLFGAC